MSSDQSLKYSNALRVRIIETAIMLMTKAGCSVTQCADESGCTLTVFNPPDRPDKHARMLRNAASQGISTDEQTTPSMP